MSVMSLLVTFTLFVGLVSASHLPACQDAAATHGLVDFLRMQDLWRTCVTLTMSDLQFYESMGLSSTRNDMKARVELAICRERIERTWAGPECRANVLANGTVAGPRDAIHDAFTPYMPRLRMRVEFKTDPCGHEGEHGRDDMYCGEWNCRTLSGLCVWQRCTRCIGPSVTPTVILE